MKPTQTRRDNTSKKHDRIRELYAKRWTNAPRPRKFSREYIIAQLAEEFYLSLKRIEDIIYTTPSLPEVVAEVKQAA